MRRIFLYLFLLFIVPAISVAQLRVIKPVKTYPNRTNLGIGIGASNSVLFLARNTSDKNNAYGFMASVVYGSPKLLRVSVDFTHYTSIDIAPTWYNIKANSIEVNLHVMYRSKSGLYFYPLGGFSYNVFKGYFTGKDDYLNLLSKYSQNQIVTTRWLGLNAGVGLEYVVKPIVFWASFKMRVGINDNNTPNILDLCYTFGIRYNLVVPSIYNVFRGTRRRYFIDKSDL